jgi:6-pyruvoyltetrahydropterin/6-carboxytetrahydropterin synthase
VEVTVSGDPDPQTGYVIDLKILKDVLDQHIIEKVDHKHLNYDVDFLRGCIPTAENIAKAFWHILAGKIPSGKLYSIKLYESANNSVEYKGE